MNKEYVEKCTILKTVVGSQCYGFATAESDTDMRGICIPPKEYFISFDKRFEQFEDPDEDTVIYNLQKFFQLAIDCSPNILEPLFIDKPKYIIFIDKWGQILKDHRQEFLSMKAKHTYSGYAYAQIKRIETHRKWLLNPPDHKPTRNEFGLSDNEELTLSGSQLGAINKIIRVDSEKFPQTVEDTGQLTGIALEVIKKENEYRNALNNWNQYLNWKATRNPKRAAIEAKFGYDCKHLCHSVRLLRTGMEILETGKLNVERSDAAELYAIRQGAWSYERAMAYAEEMDLKMTELYAHSEKCAVPYKPNRKKLSELCQAMIWDYWQHYYRTF